MTPIEKIEAFMYVIWWAGVGYLWFLLSEVS